MIKKRRLFLAALPGVLALACGRQSRSGPVDIDWGHDTDTRCHMVISDRLFAAQIRETGGAVRKFDDIGCAVFWLARQAFDEQTPGLEFWVADHRTGKWLDARQAVYLEGPKSPMRYRFGAVAGMEPGAVPYAAMKEKILALGR